MDADIKAQWIAALRSGTYKQGNSVLRVGDLYCCLGVLCDIYPDVTAESVQMNCTRVPVVAVYRYKGSSSITSLPYDLANELRIHAMGNQILDINGELVDLSLAGLNDTGFTFDQIADVIEWSL